MPTAKGMAPMIPNHVLRVGQTIRLDPAPETVNQHSILKEQSGNHGDPELDVSLDKLNQLILELDPTFEPIQVDTSPSGISLPTGTIWLFMHYSNYSVVTLFYSKTHTSARQRSYLQRCDIEHTHPYETKGTLSLGLWKCTLPFWTFFIF